MFKNEQTSFKKIFFHKRKQYNRYFHRNNVLRFRTWPTPPELSAHHCIVSAKFHARALPSRISPNGCGFFGRAFLRSSIANKTRVFCPSATHPQSAGCTCRCANGGFAEHRRTSVANPLATAVECEWQQSRIRVETGKREIRWVFVGVVGVVEGEHVEKGCWGWWWL